MLKSRTLFVSAFAAIALLILPQKVFSQDSPRNFMQEVLSRPGVAESFTPGSLGKKYPAYTDRAGWEKLLGKEQAEILIRRGEKLLDYEWKHIPASSYMAYKYTGNRTIMENPNSQNRGVLANLLYAELAEGKGRFIPKIADGLYYFAYMPSWVIAAHIVRQPGGSPLPSGVYHFIDLFNGENASTVAWCLYFTEDELNKIDPSIAQAVRRALKDNIIDPFLNPDREAPQWWMGFRGEKVNNWNPWCNFNTMQPFLLIEKDQAKINEAVARSVKSIDIYIDQFLDDGACDEGPGYFEQAAAMLYSWMQQMHDASGGKFAPFDNAKIRRMGEYESRADLGGGFMANFADASAKITPNGSLIWGYGKGVGSKELEDYALYCLRNNKDGFNKPVMSGNTGRAMELAWNYNAISAKVDSLNERCKTEGYDKVLASLRKNIPSHTWYPQTQVGFFHTKDGWSLAAKAGNNAESHNHNDIGSFILSCSNHPVLIDVGAPTYTRQTFSSERYEIFAMQSGWHNTPVINGVEQKNGAEYAASDVTFNTKGNTCTLSMDIKNAYLSESACNSWKRTLSLVDGKAGSVLTITDTYSLAERKGADEEHFITAGEIFLPGEKCGEMEVKAGTILVQDGENVIEIAYPKTLTPSVEVREVDDKKFTSVWGNKVSRVLLKSSPNAPLKGNYKFVITQK